MTRKEMRELQVQKDNLLMHILKIVGIKISKEAVFIMLEDGILTEELPFDNYLIAKLLYDTMDLGESEIKRIFYRSFSPEVAGNIVKARNQAFKDMRL